MTDREKGHAWIELHYCKGKVMESKTYCFLLCPTSHVDEGYFDDRNNYDFTLGLEGNTRIKKMRGC